MTRAQLGPWLRAAVIARDSRDLGPLAALIESVDSEAAEIVRALVARAPLKADRRVAARRDYLVATEFAALTPEQAGDAVAALHELDDDTAADVMKGRSNDCQPARERFVSMTIAEKVLIKSRLFSVLQIPHKSCGAPNMDCE